MDAGKLRHRITIQEATATVNTAGQAEYSYGTLATVWANVENRNSSKNSAGYIQAAGMATFKITIRHRTDVEFTSRVLFEGQTLEVVAITHDRLNVATFLECEIADL